MPFLCAVLLLFTASSAQAFECVFTTDETHVFNEVHAYEINDGNILFTFAPDYDPVSLGHSFSFDGEQVNKPNGHTKVIFSDENQGIYVIAVKKGWKFKKIAIDGEEEIASCNVIRGQQYKHFKGNKAFYTYGHVTKVFQKDGKYYVTLKEIEGNKNHILMQKFPENPMSFPCSEEVAKFAQKMLKKNQVVLIHISGGAEKVLLEISDMSAAG